MKYCGNHFYSFDQCSWRTLWGFLGTLRRGYWSVALQCMTIHYFVEQMRGRKVVGIISPHEQLGFHVHLTGVMELIEQLFKKNREQVY